MKAFERLRSVAAPLPGNNIDTDMIIPVRYMKTVSRSGLKQGLFYELRYDAEGNSKNFVLDQPPFDQARIIITGENFGCGSSREHAPWALLDFGIRAIIAPSFGDIFFNNCFKNGILPVVLPANHVAALMTEAQAGKSITVDLNNQQLSAGEQQYPFEIDPFRRECLLRGLDEISLTLTLKQNKTDPIARFEQRQRQQQPWLYQRRRQGV